MRRGRPVRHSKTDSVSEQPQQQPQHKTFDPFDPSHIGASTTAIRTSTTGLSGQHNQSSSPDIDDAFALNEQNLKAIENDQQKVRNSMTFDSDFQPTQRPKSSNTSATITSISSSPESSKRNSHKSLSNHLSGKSSNVKPLQSQLFDHLMDDNDNDNESPAWQQQKSLSKIDSSSISDNNLRKSNQQQPSRSHVSSSFTKNNDVSSSLTTSTTNKTDELPVLRNNVSSSIEARLNALKMSVEGVPPSTTPSPSITNGNPVPLSGSVSSSLKPSRSSTNKPAPPPKPARFRAAQNTTSSSAQKSLTESSATITETTETATTQPAPIKPSRSTTMDVSDFESKFPSIEELYKQLPVAAATALGSNESK